MRDIDVVVCNLLREAAERYETMAKELRQEIRDREGKRAPGRQKGWTKPADGGADAQHGLGRMPEENPL